MLSKKRQMQEGLHTVRLHFFEKSRRSKPIEIEGLVVAQMWGEVRWGVTASG